jgi:hypothetical protein
VTIASERNLPMSTTALRRPASPTDVMALQYAVPTRLLVIPLGILVGVVIVMSVVTALIVQGGGSAADLEYNGAVIWSLFGFIVALGVQAVSVSFPLALALGSTRRTFTLGTLASALGEALALTAAALLLLGLEALTGGWFVGAHVLSDATLGGGNPLVLVAVMVGGMLTALTVGGLYGAAWVRFGFIGPLGLGIATALLVLIVLITFLPAAALVVQALGVWTWALAGAVLIIVSVAGQYVLLRRATVR